ncbi:MAG: hypothetical protein ABSH45_05335 [Bryobacteraceae bacterium]
MTSPKLSRRAAVLLDCFLVFLFAAALIRPYFKAKYLDKWESIESTFISDARFLVAHWPHPQWQPLWYCGTRFDYIYPPALRYGTAMVSKLTGFWPVKAYHFYVSLSYALGIAGIYLLVRVASKSRAVAAWSAAAMALMSPCFLFLPNFRNDAWKLLPLRLGVLVKYGEGPHMTALAWVGVALACAWVALETRSRWSVALAAAACAAVVSHNFYGATALAIFYPILVWSFWITRLDKRIFLPAAAIPVLGYGLTAFWLVPSYFRVTGENMRYVSRNGNAWSVWVALAVAGAFIVFSNRLARGHAGRTWPVFAAGSAVFFSLEVLGNYYFDFRVSGEPLRLAPEFDLACILGAAALLGWLWSLGGRVPRLAVALVLALSFYSTRGYLRHAWQIFPRSMDYRSRVEYRVTDWLAANMPGSRIYASGSVRFWFDAWHDLAQPGGGSEQGLLNGLVESAQWEVNLGLKPEPTVLWLESLGVDAIYVSDRRSQEIFKDIQSPRKLDGVLPVAYDDHEGDTIYRVPRRFAARARVVDTARLNRARPPAFNDDVEHLRAYVDLLEKGPDAVVTVTRPATDLILVGAHIEPHQSLIVQETYDPSWQAWSGRYRLPVHKDAMGMMAIDPPPGDLRLRLEFVTPLENRIGRVATLIAIAVWLALLILDWRAARRSRPAA